MLKSTILIYFFLYKYKLLLCKKVFNIFIININKQLQANYLIVLIVFLSNFYIYLLLNLMLKYDNK